MSLRSLPLLELEPIGIVHSCFKDKFGIPRQSVLARHAFGVIELNSHPFYGQALKGLETFSHLWVIFVFHKAGSKNWKPSVRPPRLGGAKRMGVLASRSPHRPNGLGLSAVKIEKIDGHKIYVSGLDILDGSPVVDIKPYLPYADIVNEASTGWAPDDFTKISVQFAEQALDDLKVVQKALLKEYGFSPNFKELVCDLLSIDPRPASQQRRLKIDAPASHGTHYGIRIIDWDVHWTIQKEGFLVKRIVPFELK